MRRASAVLGSMILAAWAAAAQAQVDTAMVHVGPQDGGTEAFVSWPAGKAAAPGIVVVQEWWGPQQPDSRRCSTPESRGLRGDRS
jgi:hypothetical protein